jgi:hypothetical protein
MEVSGSMPVNCGTPVEKCYDRFYELLGIQMPALMSLIRQAFDPGMKELITHLVSGMSLRSKG